MKCELSCCLDVQEPKLSDVTKAVTELIGFMRDHGVTDDIFIGEFQLAAAEAINNAVEHGCGPGREAFFHARLYLRPDYVELRVVDPSDFAGWEGEPKLPDDPFDEGGRGRFLMAQMTDEILHERENGRHVLVLRKNFPDSPWSYVPGESEQTLASMTEELVSSYEMINTLIGLGEWLAVSPDMNQFMDGALERLCQVTGAETAYLRLSNNSGLQLLKQWGSSLRPTPPLLEPDSSGTEMEVFRTGDEITLPLNSVLPPGDPLDGLLISGFVTPVLFKDQRRGILVLGRTSPAQFFNAGQLKVARVVAEYLGLALTLGELQEQRGAEARALRDLEIAAEIQLSLMPQNVQSATGLDIFGTCRPALRAGGDYFDLMRLPDGAVLALIADVMGKGLPAAILATMLRTNFRACVATGITDPGALLTEINTLMSADLIKLEMFITVGCAYIPPDRTEVRFASAGHPAILLHHCDGRWEELAGTGMPIGVLMHSQYETYNQPLQLGEGLLLYTDGIAEAMSPGEEMFDIVGIQGCLNALPDLHTASCRKVVEHLLQAVDEFAAHAPPSDDRTIIAIRRKA